MTFPQFLLLDLDDTILDFDSTGAACWDHFSALYATKAAIPVGKMNAALRRSRKEYWADPGRHRIGRQNQLDARRVIVRDAFAELGLADAALAEEFAVNFTEERERWIRVFPGALETLEELRAADVRMALVTNGQASLQRAKVERFALAKYFHAILIEGELEFGKPDPRVFRLALEKIGGTPEAAWMVGDNPGFDIVPAKALGLRTVWVRLREHADENPPADWVVASLAEAADRWKRDGEGTG